MRLRLLVVPALVVLAFFMILHQIEGHIVIPKLMGAAIAVHPLLVIFGIIAGAQVFGFPGVILVLPLLALLWAASSVFVTANLGLMRFTTQHFAYVLFDYPKQQLAVSFACSFHSSHVGELMQFLGRDQTLEVSPQFCRTYLAEWKPEYQA